MAIDVRELKIASCDGVHKLAGRVYIPEKEIKGRFHVVHGMTEHIGRYDSFLRELAEDGWLAFGYDHLGHGYTANNDGELGFIASKNGWDMLARDVKSYSDGVAREFKSDESKPYVLMGHSMGSFVVRVATERYVKPQRLILMGTGGENKAAGAGLALISVIKALKGERHISPLIDKIAFGSYNDRFGGGSKDDPKPWLTTDKSHREKYYGDKFCTFNFTVSAMGDLIRLIKECNRPDWFKGVPKEMPVFLVSGEDDPVGNYGKGITEVYGRLKEQGIYASYKLYKGARHEILNDFTRDECVGDIIIFANGV